MCDGPLRAEKLCGSQKNGASHRSDMQLYWQTRTEKRCKIHNLKLTIEKSLPVHPITIRNGVTQSEGPQLTGLDFRHVRFHATLSLWRSIT